MPTRNASAVWEGELKEGRGSVQLGSGAFEGAYSFSSRFESGKGTNPEELIAAAHAGCFSMALAHGLSQAGFPSKSVKTTAKVHLEKKDDAFSIPRIDLETEAEVPGIDERAFEQQAELAKQNCPISKLLSAAEITLQAKLIDSGGGR
jgi:osmotically inducible protein OsmC